MYKSYSYNNMPRLVDTPPAAPSRASLRPPPSPPTQPSPPPPPPLTSPEPPSAREMIGTRHTAAARPKEKLFLGRFKSDDLILLAVIALLLLNECDDKLLLIALAYVFFSE